MVKEYSQLDLDNFDKIKISQKKNSIHTKDKPYRYDTKLLDKSIKQVKGQHYKQKGNFDAAIINMGLSCMVHKPKKNGYPAWEFNAQQLLEELKENGNVKAMEESDGVPTQGG